jgi:hypothetical protein
VRAFRHRTIGDEPDDLKLVGAGKEGNVSHRSVKEVPARMRSSSRECDLLSSLFFFTWFLDMHIFFDANRQFTRRGHA